MSASVCRDSNLHPDFDGGISPFPVEVVIGQDGLKDLRAWKVSSCGSVTVHLLWQYCETYPTNLHSSLHPWDTQRALNHKVLSFVTSFCFLSHLVLTSFLYTVIVFKEESCSRAMLMANRWSTWGETGWDSQLEGCFWPRSPFLWTSASTVRLFAQETPGDHFERIGQTWFSSQTEEPMFRRQVEALDPQPAQAFSYMHVRGASWMWSVPSASAPILFMISSPCGNSPFDEEDNVLQGFFFPCFCGFHRKKNRGTNSPGLYILHVLFS